MDASPFTLQLPPDAPTQECLDDLMRRFFEAVSFEPGSRPRYDQLHELFVAGGLLSNATTAPPEVAGLEGFIAPREKLVSAGTLTSFSETEDWHEDLAFGRVASRVCGYSKSGVRDGAAFSARGLIQTQFVHSAAGWRILCMSWDDERQGVSLAKASTLR